MQAHVPRGTASERSPPFGFPLSRTATCCYPRLRRRCLAKSWTRDGDECLCTKPILANFLASSGP